MSRTRPRSTLAVGLVILGLSGSIFLSRGGTDVPLRSLTPEEEKVIVGKGTEPPFTGRFWKHHEPGTYLCRRCSAGLFRSEDKFDSSCGWPSFDATVPGAVRQQPDADGSRTEIVCARCGAHLGHVFTGEGFTPRNTRHCVNSISLDFEARAAVEGTQRAIFAGGCFWGVEYHLRRVPGVISTSVGYTGGHKDSPTYREVCASTTGHAEAVEVVFDPRRTSYEVLARVFFEVHDPTQSNRQGPDVGEQYRSEIFYVTPEQKAIAQRLVETLKKRGLAVTTRITAATTFWKAEESHQDYYGRRGELPTCHVRTKRFPD